MWGVHWTKDGKEGCKYSCHQFTRCPEFGVDGCGYSVCKLTRVMRNSSTTADVLLKAQLMALIVGSTCIAWARLSTIVNFRLSGN